MSLTLECEPAVSAYPATRSVHTLTLVPTAALDVPLGQLITTALLLNVAAGAVKLLIVVGVMRVSGPT
jgi:hypothetical protein